MNKDDVEIMVKEIIEVSMEYKYPLSHIYELVEIAESHIKLKLKLKNKENNL